MLQSPYPYYGGKSTVTADVWQRFGKVDLYNEPFFGSGAMLLGRPGWPDKTTEIVNDLWGFVPNFWRAIKADPEAVAMHADIPIYECVPAGTMISTPLGDVAVENIVPGMIVLGERDGQVVETSVVATSKPRMANDFYRVGDLTLTEEHPVWTLEHGYVNARQLPAECTIAVISPVLGRTESKDEGSDQCYNQDARVQGEGQEKSCAPSKAIHVRGDTGSVLVHKRMFAKAGYNTGDNSRNTERANKEVSYYKLDVQVPVNVYNFETGTNNYFANGVLVHNCEQHAIHAMLTGQRSQLAARLEGDIEYYDAKVAGQWVWLMSMWIGHGVLSGRGPWSVELDEEGYKVLVRNAKRDIEDGVSRALPEMHSDRGVRSNIERKRLQSTAVGVRRQTTVQGVNRKRFQTHEHGVVRPVDLYDWFQALSDRFRDVYVLCGDWSRAVTPSVTTYHGTVAMFLDPPYSDAERRGNLYGEDSFTVAHDVRKWCLENGDNPQMRTALCGYSGEHDELEDLGWERFEWKAVGGYGNQAKEGSKATGKANAAREVIWFSPHCLKPDDGNVQLSILDGLL